MKIIFLEIDGCMSCPVNGEGWCKIKQKRIYSFIKDYTGIPDWCPLPEKKEKKELLEKLLSKISTKNYGDDGIFLSEEDLDKCLL